MPEKSTPATEHVNVSGYRFVHLDDLPTLQADMREGLRDTGVLGTILLAEEGINVALAGTAQQIIDARNWFGTRPELNDLWLKESYSQMLPFAKLKVRVRPEIITFLAPEQRNNTPPWEVHEAPAMPPEQLLQHIQNRDDITLLDTRNKYEVASGTFEGARHLDIDHFRDFPDAVAKAIESGELDLKKPVVTFCTGGIRCEKAAPYLIEQGFNEVYQIDGGIINYFEKCDGKHWNGDCFVFDDRIEINTKLEPTDVTICRACHTAVAEGEYCVCENPGDYESLKALEMV
ncbi:MAG: rhodanese-like domain-containing protein [Granulosicoccaceae bacterium]